MLLAWGRLGQQLVNFVWITWEYRRLTQPKPAALWIARQNVVWTPLVWRPDSKISRCESAV